MKWPAVNLVENENPWVTYCKNRVKRNNSLNIVVTGEVGTGKSWGIINFAKMYNPDWSLDYCYFSASKFVKDLHAGKFKPGDFILFDEAGIDLNSMSWQNELNRALNLIFQTMRHRRLIFAMTVPYLSFIQKGVRKLITAEFVAVKRTKDNFNIIKPRIVEYNGRLDKSYIKRLMVKSKSGVYVDFIKVPRTDLTFLNEYEKLKTSFTDKLYEEQAKRLETYENKKAGLEIKGSKRLTPKEVETFGYLMQGRTQKEIHELLGVAQSTINERVQNIRAKGYVISLDEKGTDGSKRLFTGQKPI